MRLQITHLTELLITLWTAEWCLSRVNSLMSLQMSCLTELLFTLQTTEWFLTCVNSFMDPQIVCPTECTEILRYKWIFLSHLEQLNGLPPYLESFYGSLNSVTIANSSNIWNNWKWFVSSFMFHELIRSIFSEVLLPLNHITGRISCHIVNNWRVFEIVHFLHQKITSLCIMQAAALTAPP